MLNRHASRQVVLDLVFEDSFGLYTDKNELYENALRLREIEENPYIRTLFFGIVEKQSEIDGYIEKYAKGRKLNRISKTALAVMRIAVYEMLYVESIPENVSIDEAIELSKQYDDEKTRAFVNGILHAVKEEIAHA
ncbi:MAG: transcription antitermination factor NusB [Clostridia bacterium]|nr:transcription antitermination factor NusB [Clostridia bacterium]